MIESVNAYKSLLMIYQYQLTSTLSNSGTDSGIFIASTVVVSDDFLLVSIISLIFLMTIWACIASYKVNQHVLPNVI